MDAATLVDTARRRTGLNHLGDPGVLVGLNILVESLNSEARLTASGHQRLESTIVDILANRLRVAAVSLSRS